MKSSFIRKKTLALLLMLCMALFALPAFALEFTVTKTVDLSQELPGTNDELFSAYLEQELYAPIYGGFSLFGTSAGNTLNASQKLMYDALKSRIEKVANGTSTSTVFTIDPSTIAGLQCTFTAAELGVSNIVVGSSISSAAGSAAIGKFFGNDDELFNALLHDCPLELYWFDKAAANAMGIQASFSSDGATLTVTSLTVTMQVAKSYQNGSSTKVKAANISSVVSAAQSIVNKHASKSDKEKLQAYRDEICALTSYNDEAAENTSTPYGDPWQMIYVFDGDPSTTVVCEGYSKSFQYLCDLSTFNNVECYTVSGMMGSEPHMWNIVVLDGVSYLVDVTNSDVGSAGQNGGLFLTNTPAEGDVDNGYLFLVSGQGVHYDYDNESVSLWGKDILTLGKEAAHVCSFTGDATYRVIDDYQHEAVIHCIGCEKTTTITENHTISSEATCSSSAFCDLCQVYFGDIDDTNHESSEFYYTVNSFNKLKHDKRHACCQLIVETTSHEETTPANCQNPAYCAVCDSSYGSKAPNTHALSTYKYVVNSSNPEKHDKVYDCCGKVDKTEAHSYSEATCQAPATCADCGHTTGDKGEHTMDASGKCTACGTEAVAKFTGSHGTVYYADYSILQDAIIEDHAAGTITLLQDETEDNSTGCLNLMSGEPTTLDLNGKTLIYGLVINEDTDVLIKDSASAKGILMGGIYIYNGSVKIDASADCLGETSGYGAWTIENYSSNPLVIGTDVILPAGIVLEDGGIHYTDGDSLAVDAVYSCHKHEWSGSYSSGESTHWYKCLNCDAKKDEAAHTGGTADCSAQAKCSVCNAPYGSTNPDAHSYTYTVTGGTIYETCANGCTHHAEAALMPPANLVYDGTAKSATIEDKFSGRLNLTITYSTADGSAPVAPGKYTASIIVGSSTASVEFEIAAAALNAEVTLSPATVTYNGTEQKPTVTVTGLTEGKDYTVTFPADMTNAGVKTITVTGKGNYAGVATKTFTIEKANLTAADFTFSAPADLTYDGKAKIAAVTTAKTDAAVTVKYSADPVNAGDYSVSIDVAESANYKAASLSGAAWTFSIAPKTVTNPTFSGLETLYLHTGSAIEPTFTLKDGETEIPASEYTVAYSNNVNVGTATVTVSDKTGGNYTVSGTATFAIATHEHVWSYTASGNVITATCSGTIGTCPNKTVTLTVTASSAVYDGSAKTAAVTVDPTGAIAAPAITYSTADGTAPVDAGTYEASIKLGDAAAKTSLTIEKANLTAADFVFTAPANLVYDGNTKIAKVVCTKTDCVITVKYNADPVNVGTYTVSIDAAQSKNYNNATLSSEDWTFAITPASIASATVAAAEQVYTGEELKPAVTVILGGKTLLEGTDFTAAYSDNVNVGSAKITVTGKGNYEGTANGTFEIKTSGSALTANADKTAYTYGEQIIVTAKAELSQQKRSLFALRAITPTMALYYGDTKLDEAEVVNGEANLSYMTAGRAFAPADKIELTVRYSGDANMAESETTVSFSMSKKTLTPGLGGSVTKVYDGETTISSADDLFFSVSGTMKGDLPMVNASSFAFADANVGENKAVTASGYTLDETSAKYYALSATEATANVGKITPASIAGATVTADNEVYTGEELKPAVTVTLGGKTLIEGTDFTVAYSDNTLVGTAKITVTGKGNYEGTANGTFEIGKARPVTEAPAGLTAVYGDLLSTVALPDHDLGTWNWVTPDAAVGNAGVQTHEVIFIPFDAEQYISVTLDAKVTVTKANMTFGDSFKVLLGSAENTAFTYGDIVTVKAQPRMGTPVFMTLRALVAPKANQMALFCGDKQISEAVDPDADGVYTMTYDTSDKALAAGSSTITAKYVGTENLNDYSASAAITIAKRELTITSVKANNRVHKAGNTKVTVTGAEFDGKLSGDDVNIAPVKGDVGSDAIGTYTTVTLPELTLVGSDASFYTLKPAASASTNVKIVEVPADMPVEPELDSFDDTDISDELKDAGFDSTDDITNALKDDLDNQVAQAEAANPTTTPGAQPKEIIGTETHNIGIMYNEDGEEIEGDPEHFPQSGLTVLLPIPEGTAPDTHEYYGSFMTGNTNGDQIAGSVVPLTVEVVAGENGEQMLRVEIPAMGQVMIGWVAKPVNLPETSDASNMLLWLAMLAISCPAMLFTFKKMKRSMR